MKDEIVQFMELLKIYKKQLNYYEGVKKTEKFNDLIFEMGSQIKEAVEILSKLSDSMSAIETDGAFKSLKEDIVGELLQGFKNGLPLHPEWFNDLICQ
jgi:hypothetical protein